MPFTSRRAFLHSDGTIPRTQAPNGHPEPKSDGRMKHLGLYLDAYRRLICQREGHTHGEAGELECILRRLAQEQSELDKLEESEPTGSRAPHSRKARRSSNVS